MRSAAEFKKTEKEVVEDSVAYLRDRTTYKKIVVFIYDQYRPNRGADCFRTPPHAAEEPPDHPDLQCQKPDALLVDRTGG